VNFSDYHGGASIGSIICKRAGEAGIEYISFYAFVPAYDFSESSPMSQSLRIDTDHRAWWELMRRLNYMFDLDLSLSELRNRSDELTDSMRAKLAELDSSAPQLKVQETMRQIAAEFNETPFLPMDDVWERELRDLFRESDV